MLSCGALTTGVWVPALITSSQDWDQSWHKVCSCILWSFCNFLPVQCLRFWWTWDPIGWIHHRSLWRSAYISTWFDTWTWMCLSWCLWGVMLNPQPCTEETLPAHTFARKTWNVNEVLYMTCLGGHLYYRTVFGDQIHSITCESGQRKHFNQGGHSQIGTTFWKSRKGDLLRKHHDHHEHIVFYSVFFDLGAKTGDFVQLHVASYHFEKYGVGPLTKSQSSPMPSDGPDFWTMRYVSNGWHHLQVHLQ